jgi:hypothetical protein
MAKTDKSKFISLLFISIFCLVFAYWNRCYVVSCSPASWKKIVEIAFAHSGTDFRIDYISARPSHFWNSYTEAGPAFIDIDVKYISLQIDGSIINENNINHPVKHLEFNDFNLITMTRTGSSWANYVPPEDGQEKLKRVTVHPRDAFRMTWSLAEKDSALPAKSAHVSALLSFNRVAKKFRCESIWAIFYYYDHIALTYYIDAQTGEIISSEKNLY